MAKPKAEGFPYSQEDTDIFFDSRIRTLISRFGCDGYALWDYIKQAAYREHGYYVEWDDERKELAAADLYMSVEKIGLILDYLLKRSLLVSKPFNAVTVLTSHGIQSRFQKMARDTKRSYIFRKEIWVLNEEETLGSIFYANYPNNSGIKGFNSGINPDNSGIKQQSKEKESKEKNSKIKYGNAPAREATPLERFLEKWGVNSTAIGNYSGGQLSAIDWDKLSARVEKSKGILQKRKDIGFFIKHYADILDGAYDDWEKEAPPKRVKKSGYDEFDGSSLADIQYD